MCEICIGGDGPIEFYNFLHINTNSTEGDDDRRADDEENYKDCQNKSGIPFIDFLDVGNSNWLTAGIIKRI